MEWRKWLPFPLNMAEAAAEQAVLARPRLRRSILWLGGTVRPLQAAGVRFRHCVFHATESAGRPATVNSVGGRERECPYKFEDC
jgi:hypothetical protein